MVPTPRTGARCSAPQAFCFAGKVLQSSRATPIIELDIVVDAGRRVIPEIDMFGRAPRAGLINLTLDPENPALTMHSGSTFERTVVHERYDHGLDRSVHGT